MDHLKAEHATARLAKQAHPLANDELFLLLGVEVQQAHGEAAGGVLHLSHQLAATAQADLAIGHHAFDLLRHAGAQLGDGRAVGFIFVAQRQVQEQVLRAVDVELGQPTRQLRADAGPAGAIRRCCDRLGGRHAWAGCAAEISR